MPVTVDTDLPLHDDRGREWDGDAARSAMARRCATDDGVMADCMGRGFIWRDPEANAATIGAYDLPVADVFDGDLHLVLSGVQAAANSISPAREPGSARALDAPESDLSRMRSAVETILARFARHFDDEEIRAPWESETAAAEPNGKDDEDEDERRRATYASAGCGCNCGQQPKPTDNDQDSPTEEQAMSETTTAPTAAPRSRVLRASATGGEWRPPVEHFANPHMTEPTKLTVTADGRVYGHLATWDQPHIGYDGKLVYPPRSASGEYEYFRQSRVVTADGSALAVGLITMATGHADDNLSADAAAAHYDNTGTMVAAVNVGEDQHGIWLAGSMLPDVSPEQRARFSLARVSGDWRQPRPGAGLELIAALSVPNPGFPVRQSPELLAADRLTLAASAAAGIDPSVVRIEQGQVRTFITAGADVVDQQRAAELSEAVGHALAGPLAEQIRTAVAEALAERDQAATRQAAPEAAPTPDPEGSPAPEGQTEPAPAPSADASEGEAAPAAEAPATGGEAAPAAEAGGAPPGEAIPAETPPAPAPAPAPAAEAAPAAEPSAAAVAASSALARRVRLRRAHGARERLMAAAGGRSKKA